MGSPHLPVGFKQDDLLPAHFDEWANHSGVDPEIVRLNVVSLIGDEVHEALIGDRNEELGAHASQYVTRELHGILRHRIELEDGGWWCEGVDLQNGCRTLSGWGVFKPDTPRVTAGRPRKYEHPLGVDARIVALRMPNDPDYWARIKADPSIEIVLEESGGKKLGAWLTAGIPALGIPGLWDGTPPVDKADPEPRIGNGYGFHEQSRSSKPQPPKKRKLHPDLMAFVYGRTFTVSFDYEPTEAGRNRRDQATRLLVKQLYLNGAALVKVAHRQGPEKGADDLLLTCGPQGLRDLLATAYECKAPPHGPTYSVQPALQLPGTRDPADEIADFIAEQIRHGRSIAAELERPATDYRPLLHLTNTPGTGKSHLAPQVGPRLLEIPGVDRVIYVSSTYRSPSVGGLLRWTEPPSRHSGLVVEEVGDQQRLRRRKSSESLDDVAVQPTCAFADGLLALQAQGYSPEATTHFCSKQCPARMGCPYLQQRGEFIQGLKSGEIQLIRCSTEMLRPLQALLEKKWAQTFLIFDEAPQINSAAITTTELPMTALPAWGSWLRTRYAKAYPEQVATLSEVIDTLATLPDHLEPDQVKYGATPNQIAPLLPALPELQDLPFLQEIDPDQIHDLIPDTHGELLSDPEQPLLLPALLKAVAGLEASNLSYSAKDKGRLVISRRSLSLVAAFLASAGAMVMDGTAATDDIELALAEAFIRREHQHPAPIAFKSASTLRPAQFELIQVTGLGNLGRQRGTDIQKRLKALIEALRDHLINEQGPEASLGVLEKNVHRDKDDGWGAWFVDNQGSNAFQHNTGLAMCGLPAPNFTATLTAYQLLHNNPAAHFNCPGFRAWYGRLIGEQLIQAIHRLRPIRREGQHLYGYLITDANLDTLNLGDQIQKRSADSFTRAAARKSDRTSYAVEQAICSLFDQGTPVDQISKRRVAQLVGCSPTTALRQASDRPWEAFVRSLIFDF